MIFNNRIAGRAIGWAKDHEDHIHRQQIYFSLKDGVFTLNKFELSLLLRVHIVQLCHLLCKVYKHQDKLLFRVCADV